MPCEQIQETRQVHIETDYKPSSPNAKILQANLLIQTLLLGEKHLCPCCGLESDLLSVVERVSGPLFIAPTSTLDT